MPIVSLDFALGLGVAVIGFFAAPSRCRPALLLAYSLLYYSTWEPLHTLWLVGFVGFTYLGALGIAGCAKEGSKLWIALLSVGALVSMLVISKLGANFGSSAAVSWLAPLGISYLMFRAIGYILDVYWDNVQVQRNFFQLNLYVAFFPQVVAGPIQRAGDFFSQIASGLEPTEADVIAGLRRILLGLVKKIVVADQLAMVVDNVHGNLGGRSVAELLLTSYVFSLQLYFDFSGLTDVALGIGRLFGIRGPENFNLPFFAPNLQEYWRRWHMSLTSWLTDYLFMPLRMNLRRWGTVGLAAAIFINMMAVGVWHGVRATFVAFGCLNGIFLVVSVLTLKRRDKFIKNYPFLVRWRWLFGPIVTWHLVVFTFIFFRADSLESACVYLRELIVPAGPVATIDWSVLGYAPLTLGGIVLLAVLLEFGSALFRNPVWNQRFASAPRVVRWGLYYGGIGLILISRAAPGKFLYEKF